MDTSTLNKSQKSIENSHYQYRDGELHYEPKVIMSRSQLEEVEL